MHISKRLLDELQNEDYEPFRVTKDGLEHLREKLARLKRALPDRIEEVRRTAAYGDRSENDEYKLAKGTLRRTKWQILNTALIHHAKGDSIAIQAANGSRIYHILEVR